MATNVVVGAGLNHLFDYAEIGFGLFAANNLKGEVTNSELRELVIPSCDPLTQIWLIVENTLIDTA